MKKKDAKNCATNQTDSTQAVPKDYSFVLKLDFRAIVVLSVVVLMIFGVQTGTLESFVNMVKALIK